MLQKHTEVIPCATIPNFVQDQSHCTITGLTTIENRNKPLFLKELKKLWDKEEPNLPWEKGEYTPSNTLLLDDSPYKALRNPVWLHLFSLTIMFDCINPFFTLFFSCSWTANDVLFLLLHFFFPVAIHCNLSKALQFSGWKWWLFRWELLLMSATFHFVFGAF